MIEAEILWENEYGANTNDEDTVYNKGHNL